MLFLRPILLLLIVLTAHDFRANAAAVGIDDKVDFEKDIKDDNEEGARMKRVAQAKGNKIWTGGVIPLKFSDEIVGVHKQHILDAMHMWEDATCITFPDATGMPESIEAPQVFVWIGNGCKSGMGMSNNMAVQRISIVPKCGFPAILHEFGHRIGLWHEREREDRDDWIWYRTEFAKNDNLPADQTEFAEDGEDDTLPAGETVIEGRTNTFGFNYSYLSVMHPGPFAGCPNGKKYGMHEPTMLTLWPEYQFRLNTKQSNPKQGLSYEDIGYVNKMYQCGAHCTNECEEGFLDKNCVCLCPGTTANPTRPCSEPRPVEECVDSKVTMCARQKKKGNCPEKKWDCHKSCALCGPECQDARDDCVSRAKAGECRGNVAFMLEYCRESCGFCYGEGHEVKCRDTLGMDCMRKAANGACLSDPNWMAEYCRASCGACL